MIPSVVSFTLERELMHVIYCKSVCLNFLSSFFKALWGVNIIVVLKMRKLNIREYD